MQHDGSVEEFKAEIMKEAKVYVEWAISNSSGDNTKIFLDQVQDKMEKHFERNPSLGPADFDKLRSAMMAYAKDFFHAELIPPGDLLIRTKIILIFSLFQFCEDITPISNQNV
jgi:hypothetical protein